MRPHYQRRLSYSYFKMSSRSNVSNSPGLAGGPTVYAVHTRPAHLKERELAYRAGVPTRYTRRMAYRARTRCVYRTVRRDRSLLERPGRRSTTLRQGSLPPPGAAERHAAAEPGSGGLTLASALPLGTWGNAQVPVQGVTTCRPPAAPHE